MNRRATFSITHLAAIAIGNGLEFYDFLVYALYAVYIGNAFFPSRTPSSSLLLSLATFGAGFISRPIGGIVIGHMGDRLGRKPAMLLSFFLMGVGMLGLALTPTYAEIGIAAPVLVLAFRLIQGFALGGEVGPTTAYMIEAAPPLERGVYGSLQYMTQRISTLIAALVGVVLASLLDAHALASWGWRVAFLLGVLVVPFGIAIRRNLPETLEAPDDAALAPDGTRGTFGVPVRITRYLKEIFCGFVMLSSGTISIYVIIYLTTYALTTLHTTAMVSLGLTIVTSIAGAVAQPLAGWLSDRIGRKPVMIVPAFFSLVTIVPTFWCILHTHSIWLIYAVAGLAAFVSGVASAPVIVSLTESLPRAIRSGAVATVYAFAISIFGGTAQFIVAWLTQRTGNPYAPAWYWTAAVALGFAGMLLMPESAPAKLRGGQSPAHLC